MPDSLQDSDFEAGKSLGLFKIFGKQDSELLSGEDDRHLNFRVSFYLERLNRSEPFQYNFILSTTVLFNGPMGRIYFFPVKPFHRFIVPAMMKRVLRTKW